MRRRMLLAGLAGLPLLLTSCPAGDCTWAEPDGEPCDGDRDEPCVCTAPDGTVVEEDADQSGWRHRHKPAPKKQPAVPPPQRRRPAPAPRPPRR